MLDEFVSNAEFLITCMILLPKKQIRLSPVGKYTFMTIFTNHIRHNVDLEDTE